MPVPTDPDVVPFTPRHREFWKRLAAGGAR